MFSVALEKFHRRRSSICMDMQSLDQRRKVLIFCLVIIIAGMTATRHATLKSTILHKENKTQIDWNV
jgi:hypothetical protein